MQADTELLLMFAARAEHVQRVILPALQLGKWVICDRFIDASFAYQGGGRGIAAVRISALEDWALDGLRPGLTLLLDAEVTTGLARARGRGTEDRFEQETVQFFERVRQRYLERAGADSARIKIIDANRELSAVRASITSVLDVYLA
jgi:dTMP kinase